MTRAQEIKYKEEIAALKSRLEEAEQRIDAIKAGGVDAFAFNTGNQAGAYARSGDFAYRMFVENFTNGALSLNEQGLIVYANKYFYDMLGLAYEQVIGQSMHDYVHPQSKDVFKTLFNTALGGQSNGKIEIIAREKVMPVLISLTSLQPRLHAVNIILTDLTEKKHGIANDIRNSKIIAKSEKQFQRLFEQAPVAMCVLRGPDHVVEVASERQLQLWGKTAEQALHKPLFEALPEGRSQGYESMLQKALAGETIVLYETPVESTRFGTKETIIFNFTLQPLRAADGTVSALVSVGIDVTEQVAARRKIEVSEKLQRYFVKLSDGIRTLTDPIAIQYVAAKILGEHLGAQRVVYASIDANDYIIERDWTNGAPSLSGRHPLQSYPQVVYNTFQSGKNSISNNVAEDPVYSDAEKAVYKSIGVQAFLGVPLVKDNKLAVIFVVTQANERIWTTEDISLATETAERIWAAVEKAKAEEALRESEQQLQSVIENLPNSAVFIVDKNLTYLFAEGQALHESGFKESDFKGKKVQEVTPAELVDEYLLNFNKIFAGGDFIHEHRTNGFDFTTRGVPLTNTAGEIYGALVISYDITKRKKAELALRASEEKYRNIFENIDEGFIILDVVTEENGKIIDMIFREVNDAFEKHTGVKPALGKKVSELFPVLTGMWYDAVSLAYNSGQAQHIEGYYADTDRWISTQCCRVGAEGSRLLSAIFIDITERKRTEQNLALLADVSKMLSELNTIESAMQLLGEKIAKHFNTKWCTFNELDNRDQKEVCVSGWNDADVFSLNGTYRLRDYWSDKLIEQYDRGELRIVNDTQIDADADVQNYTALNILSFINVPLAKAGQWEFLVSIADTKVREWRSDEIELLQELSARIWTRIERARAEELLRASEEKYRNIFETAEVSLWEEDFTAVKIAIDELKTQGITDFQEYFDEHPEFVAHMQSAVNVTDVNQTTVQMFEAKNKAELLGSLPRIFTPESQHVFTRELVAIAKGEPLFFAEALLQTVKGNPVWIFFSMKLPSFAENFDKVLFSCLDISKTKKSEAALHESEEKYRKLFTYIDDGFQIIEVIYGEGNKPVDILYLETNPAFAVQTGLKNVAGKRASELGLLVEEGLLHAFDQVAKTKNATRYEDYNASSNRWYSVFLYPANDTERPVVAGLVTDITARKRHEKNLALLADVSKRLQEFENLDHAIKALSEKIATHFDGSGCNFLKLTNNPETTIFSTGWHEGDVPSMEGLHLGKEYWSEQQFASNPADAVIIVNDTQNDTCVDAKQHVLLNIRSFVSVPLARDGEFRFMMVVLDTKPRVWRNDEVELMKELAERIWASVERDLVEKQLSASAIEFSKLAAIVQSSEDAILSKTLDGVITSWNPGAEKLFGYTAKEIIGQPINKIIPAECLHEERDILNKIINAETIRHFETKRVTKTGSLVDLSISISPLYDREGKIVGASTIARDITETKRVQEELTALNNQLELSMSAGNVGTWTLDVKSNYLRWNKQQCALYGISEADFDNDPNTYWNFVSEEDKERLNNELEQHFASKKKDITYEFRITRKDGKLRWLESRNRTEYDSSGKPHYITGINLDITEAKLFSHELERQVTERTEEISKEKKFTETILDSTPDLIGAYDTEMRVIAFNKACEALYNVAFEEVKGKRFTEIFPKAKGGHAEQDLVRALRGEHVHNAVFQSAITGRSYENFVLPLRDEHGEIYGAVAIAHDITENLKAIDLIKKSAEEVAVKNTELQRANKELESFSYIASHDLQEPLRKIITFINLIQKSNFDNASTEKYFEKISGSASRMSKLIQSVLEYSQLSRTENEFTSVDLNGILEDVKNDFELVIAEKQATIQSNRLPVIRANALQMNQLFSNLISNALKFSKERPEINIRAKLITGKGFSLPVEHVILNPEREYLQLSFADNGIGFAPEFKEKIFDVFQRLHGQSEYTGTGIGLSIVRKIVEAHGGFASARSKDREGAEFIIVLPK